MPPINIAIPESLTAQKTELETILAGIAVEEGGLADQRKEVQDALRSIDTGIAVLSGQPLPANKPVASATRKPMSPEAKNRIAEGLHKAAQAKAMAKAIRVAASAAETPAPRTLRSPNSADGILATTHGT